MAVSTTSNSQTSIFALYAGFRRSRSGLLTLWGFCPSKFSGQAWEMYLLGHDDTRHETSFLVADPMPIADSKNYAWNAVMNRALISFGSIFSGLYWMDNNGSQPVTGTIAAYGRQFSLATAWSQQAPQGSEATGNAKWPAWSPDDSTVAFFASTDAIGRGSMDRLSGRWSLYLMDAVALEPAAVLHDILWPGGIVWSGDGRFLAFNGQLGTRGEGGIWILEIGRQSASFAATGEFCNMVWSEDGKYLFAFRYADENLTRVDLLQYDVSQITQARSR